MPRARNRWERAVQVLRWIVHEFDLPEGIAIELVPDIDNGKTFGHAIQRRSGRLVVQLSERACRTYHDMVFNVMHEGAHLILELTRGHDPGDDHDDWFWIIFGRINRKYDRGGDEASRAFPVD